MGRVSTLTSLYAGFAIISNSSLASENLDRAIPFIVENKNLNSQVAADSYSNKTTSPEDTNEVPSYAETLVNHSAKGIERLVKIFKEDICSSNKNGAFEITLKVDASGKLFGVGASGEGGIKAIVRCEKEKPE